MSSSEVFVNPDNELFDEGVTKLRTFDWETRTNLFGLFSIKEQKKIIPCIYKSIISYKNGFARAINKAGQLVYVGSDGDILYDEELPFVPELCSDFDDEGIAEIGCLVDNAFVVKGHMEMDGTMYLKNYNC